MKSAALWLGILCLLVQGCASRGSSAEGGILTRADAEEIAVGQQINTAIMRSFYPYTDPKVVTYVNELGDSLARQSERDLTYRFTILYSDKIYATSAPGGFVYVTTGMLYFLDNEAELAGVLAHEIAELQFRNANIAADSRKMVDTLTKGGMMVGPAFGPIGALTAVGLAALNHVSQPREIQPEEKLIRADAKALNYMLKAGQDPQGLVDVFYKILRANNEVIPYFYDYYQSRPISEGRFAALNEAFSNLPMDDQSFSVNREAYQEVTKGIREMYKAS
jgi:predicted Zn-dependent protease